MVTLASIVIAVPLGVLAGLLVGIAAYRHPAFERGITPVLDLMQTVPVFAYLVPILWFFGFSPVAAMVATDHLRDPADGPQRRAGPAARAGRGQGIRPDGRLHAPPDDVAGADPVGPAVADGRRQPGDHAVAQHGDHRLDDRRGRARPRRAGGAAAARLRRRARGRGRDHAARDRARPPEPGLRRAPAAGAMPRPSRTCSGAIPIWSRRWRCSPPSWLLGMVVPAVQT